MPGICGILDGNRPRPLVERAAALMASRLRRRPWHATQMEALGPVVATRVRVQGTPSADARGMAQAGPFVLLFDGEIYRARGAGEPDEQYVVNGLAEHGPAFLAHLPGCFTCAAWDRDRETLHLATDRFGMRPLFWAQHAGSFAFASEIGGLIAAGVPATPSETGHAEFLAFGHFLGDSSLYAHAHAAPAAAWLTYDPRAGIVTVEAHASSLLAGSIRSDAEWLDEIERAFSDSVERACATGGMLGLSLSGGLDARTILGVAPSDVTIQCVSLGIPGSIDLRAAGSMARMAGQPFHAQHLDGDFLGRFEPLLREMVSLTDGHYLDQGIVLTTLPAYRELGITALLRGHAGELLHMSKAYAFSMDEAATRIASPSALADWLWHRLTGYMIGALDERFFSKGFGARVRDIARASLERRLANWSGVEPVPQRIWRLFLDERLRRETAASLQMFRSFLEVRLPYLDPHLVSLLLAAPVHLKIGDTLQAHILRNRRSDFLRIVNANTGAPMQAGPLRAAASTFAMRALGRLGVRGFQPYERLGLWLARDLQPLLKRVLLDEAFLDRGLLDRALVAALIEEHRTRERNHTFLLMALVVLALGSVAGRESEPSAMPAV